MYFGKYFPLVKVLLSLFCFDDEVLKFDCFGKDKGHYHTNLYCPYQPKENRFYFSEKTVEEQINRTIFELTKNLSYYLQRHPKRRIRAIKIDRVALESVCIKARDKMFEYLLLVPEFEELHRKFCHENSRG